MFKLETVINGKKVTLKKRLPVGDAHNLPDALQKAAGGDYLDHIPAMTMLIESWEFDGSPADPEAYKALDIFDEMMPLEVFANTYITDRMAAINGKKT